MHAPLIAALLLSAPGQAQDDPAAWSDVVPPPRDVTAATLADPEALAALEAPGEVLFEDGFEGGEEGLERYFEIRGRGDGRVRLDGVAHSGEHSLRCVAPENDGKESGSGASGWLGDGGHGRVYFRRYIRFAEDYDQGNLNHTGGGMAGVAGSNKWGGMGKAGVRPRGDDRFTVGFEPWRDWGREAAPGTMFLYAYWVDMERGGDGNWWGNMLVPAEERRVVPERGRWVCLEQMVQVNEIGESDGEVAAWVDGELVLHMTGIRWRTEAGVLVKRFNLGVYVHRAERENVVWYDDVVLSTGYVGLVGEAGDDDEADPDASGGGDEDAGDEDGGRGDGGRDGRADAQGGAPGADRARGATGSSSRSGTWTPDRSW